MLGSSLGIRSSLLVVALACGACNGPVGPFPGGRLEGEVRPAPADWSSAGAWGNAKLETRPSQPYSVTVAYTIVDGALYVNSNGERSQWVRNIEARPDVRLLIDEALYELRAERVSGAEEIAAFGSAWVAQKFTRDDPRIHEEVFVYRLVAR